MAKQIDINSLANAIYQGRITPRNLPETVYHVNAEKIVDGIYKGYGKTLKDIAYDSPEFKMLNSLRENAYIFSGAKTFQQTLLMTEAMTDGDRVLPFDEFKDKVESLNVQFNENYLETEYNTAIASSQNASSWERFEQDAETLPYLTYETIGDACEICLPLDGITLPVNDEFWNKFYPPNHFNCYCVCLNSDDESNLTGDWKRDREMGRLEQMVSDTFQMNSGKLGETFSKDHPYFAVPPEYKEFAKDNFGLEIPEPEVGTETPETETQTEPDITKTPEELYPDVKINLIGDMDILEQMTDQNKVQEHLLSAGIPTDIKGEVKIAYSKFLGDISVRIQFEGSGVTMKRYMNLETKTIENQYFRIEKDSSFKGQGAEIFKSQVDNASKFGFKQIETYGAGDKTSPTFNGYYTWARLGYEPKAGQLHIDDTLRKFNKENQTNADFMRMMSTKKGQEFWKEKGHGTEYKFDLTKDSKNQQALQGYIDDKRKK